MSSLREQFLLHRIRAFKDQRAFGELVADYRPISYRYLRSKLPTEQDAEDALNTSLLRTWNYITRAEHVESVGGLIFTVARGVVSEFYRHRVPNVSIESMQEAGMDIEAKGGGERSMTQSAEVQLAKELLDQLEGEDRLIILMRHFEGRSLREIAQRVGKSEGATRVALHRAMKKMRNLFMPRT